MKQSIENPHGITVGGDPEIALYLGDEPISAHEIIPGTKEKPHKLASGACQLDGMAVEINIDPAKSEEEYEHNINSVIGEVRKIVPSKYSLRYVPCVQFSPLVLDRVPTFHKELGCNPDWNAYSGLINPSPMERLKLISNHRSFGGHISAGWTKDKDKEDPSHVLDCEMVIKNLDPFYMHIKEKVDADVLRAELYGKPGAYRPTPFGVEYRTPSNAWVGYPRMYRYMFGLVVSVINGMHNGLEFQVPKFKQEYLEQVRAD